MDRLFTRTDQLNDVITRSILDVFPVDPPNLIAWQQFVHARTAFRYESTKTIVR